LFGKLFEKCGLVFLKGKKIFEVFSKNKRNKTKKAKNQGTPNRKRKLRVTVGGGHVHPHPLSCWGIYIYNK
jgi:hypothetical protein